MIDIFETDKYTDCYFSKSKEAAEVTGHNPTVVWQVFQKTKAVFCGLSHIIPMLMEADEVFALEEGDLIEPFEPALIIKAPFQKFVEFETVYLGIIARMTRIATNVHAAVVAAKGKPVLFFPARFDVPETQQYDGYAAYVGGAAGCATREQQEAFALAGETLHGKTISHEPVGTMPHALIAAYGGDTTAAALAFAEARPNEPVWVLVDFHNDCAKTAVEVCKAFAAKGLTIAGVRLDTSEKLVDEGIKNINEYWNGTNTGVNGILVRHVRKQLDDAGFPDVKIAVSGGFTPEKIALFEANEVPVDVYAVGEGFLKGSTAFTSDIVARMDGNNLIPCAKVGRGLKSSKRLNQLKGNGLAAAIRG